MRQISKDWFKKDTLFLARELLGKVIEYNGCKGMIVETEAYKSDPASHGCKLTPRSEIMHTTFGRWYVYLIYGMYYCLNITTHRGEVGAVLIRAVEPIEGQKLMFKRRKIDKLHNLTSGPGKLCQAFGITKKLNNTEINDIANIYHYKKFKDSEIKASKRIGITQGKDLDWRFYVKGNKFVSKF